MQRTPLDKESMTTQQKPKKRILPVFWWLLIPVLIAAFFYMDAEHRYYKSFRYDLRADYRYAFPSGSVSPVMIERDGFQWPLGEKGLDTAFLKIAVRSDWTSFFCFPYIEIRYRGMVLRQYFEKTGRGIRYLNLSPLFKTLPPPAMNEKIVLEGHHLAWNPGASELYLFRNPEIKKARILILAPHPDDAEIAAFGLYNNQDAYIITLTAGEGGKQKYKRFFKDPKNHALFQGKVRTWDSIVIPFWGGIPPEKCFNLGYFDETLHDMFRNPARKTGSHLAETFDLNTFRQYNLSDLLPKNAPEEPTWNNLVATLEHLLTEINPSVIVTPNPLTDAHPDHQFTTVALLEALQKTPAIKGSLYLYTVHDSYSTRWPLGNATSIVSLPPFFSQLPFFEKIYSHSLTPEAYNRKLFAMDDMHDLRPVYFISPEQFTRVWLTLLQSFYLHWKGALTMRKYLRRDELFFVAPAEKAPYLHELFLKNFPTDD